jgi:hypothetical protein
VTRQADHRTAGPACGDLVRNSAGLLELCRGTELAHSADPLKRELLPIQPAVPRIGS